MNAALLPALAPIAPIAPVAPTTPAAGATPAAPGAFAQELSQAQTAAPTDEQAPAAQPQTAPAADDAAPAKPAAAGDEAPVSKSLRQWLQQTAAARRAAHKVTQDTSRLPTPSIRDSQPADPLDPATRPRRGQRGADTELTTPATTGIAIAKPPLAADDQTDLGIRASAGQVDADTAKPIAPETSATPLAAAPPVATPAVTAATSAVAGPAFQAITPTVPASTKPGPTTEAAEAAPSGEPGMPLATAAHADDGRGALRAVLPDRAPPGAQAEAPIEATRGGPSAAKALRETASEPGAPVEERESFATALARQQESTAIVVPPAPQAASGTSRPDGAAPAPRPAVDVPIPADFNGPQWAQSVGNQLSLLATDGVQNARLHLHPAEMGPISVQIVVDGQTAQVHLAVDNAETRQALEQAMPNLAASLQESGLTLTGGGVFEQPRQRAGQAPDDGRRTADRAGERGPAGDLAEPTPAGAAPARTWRRQGVVDLYA